MPIKPTEIGKLLREQNPGNSFGGLSDKALGKAAFKQYPEDYPDYEDEPDDVGEVKADSPNQGVTSPSPANKTPVPPKPTQVSQPTQSPQVTGSVTPASLTDRMVKSASNAVRQAIPGAGAAGAVYDYFTDPQFREEVNASALDVAKAVPRTIAQMGSDVVRGLGQPERSEPMIVPLPGAKRDANGMYRIPASMAYTLGKKMSDAYKASDVGKALAPTPGREDSPANIGASALTSAGVFAGTAALNPGVAMATALAGGAGEMSRDIEEMRNKGAQISPDTERLAMAGGALVGSLDTIPGERLASGGLRAVARKVLPGVVSKTGTELGEKLAEVGARHAIVSAGTQAVLEGSQEAVQQLAQNLIARGLYDNKRSPMENVAVSFVGGAFAGAALDATIGRVGRKLLAQMQEQESAAQHGQAQGTQVQPAQQPQTPQPVQPQPAQPQTQQPTQQAPNGKTIEQLTAERDALLAERKNLEGPSITHDGLTIPLPAPIQIKRNGAIHNATVEQAGPHSKNMVIKVNGNVIEHIAGRDADAWVAKNAQPRVKSEQEIQVEKLEAEKARLLRQRELESTRRVLSDEPVVAEAGTPTATPEAAATTPEAPKVTDPVSAIPQEAAETTQPKHKYASTQVNLAGSEKLAVRGLASEIDPADLAPEGVERNPHITVKYGLHDDASIEKVRELLANHPPIEVTLGETSLFPDSGDGEVVKVGVHSPQLTALNKLISDNIPNTTTFKDYKPHITLAYVQPGKGAKYTGPNDLTGSKITLHSVAFSDRNRNQIEIPLGNGQSNQSKTAIPAATTSTPTANPPVAVAESQQQVPAQEAQDVTKRDMSTSTEPVTVSAGSPAEQVLNHLKGVPHVVTGASLREALPNLTSDEISQAVSDLYTKGEIFTHRNSDPFGKAQTDGSILDPARTDKGLAEGSKLPVYYAGVQYNDQQGGGVSEQVKATKATPEVAPEAAAEPTPSANTEYSGTTPTLRSDEFAASYIHNIVRKMDISAAKLPKVVDGTVDLIRKGKVPTFKFAAVPVADIAAAMESDERPFGAMVAEGMAIAEDMQAKGYGTIGGKKSNPTFTFNPARIRNAIVEPETFKTRQADVKVQDAQGPKKKEAVPEKGATPAEEKVTGPVTKESPTPAPNPVTESPSWMSPEGAAKNSADEKMQSQLAEIARLKEEQARLKAERQAEADAAITEKTGVKPEQPAKPTTKPTEGELKTPNGLVTVRYDAGNVVPATADNVKIGTVVQGKDVQGRGPGSAILVTSTKEMAGTTFVKGINLTTGKVGTSMDIADINVLGHTDPDLIYNVSGRVGNNPAITTPTTISLLTSPAEGKIKPVVRKAGERGAIFIESTGKTKEDIKSGASNIYRFVRNLAPAEVRLSQDFGDVGKFLNDRIYRGQEMGESMAGIEQEKLKKAGALAKDLRNNPRAVQEAHDILSGLLERSGDEKVNNAVAAFRDAFDNIGWSAKALDMQLMTPEGKKVAFQVLEDYFPRTYPWEALKYNSPQRRDIVRNITHQGWAADEKEALGLIKDTVDYWEGRGSEEIPHRLMEWAVKHGEMGETRADVARSLANYRRQANEAPQSSYAPKHSSLDYRRKTLLPVYDPNIFRVGMANITTAYKRIGMVAALGQEDQVVKSAIAAAAEDNLGSKEMTGVINAILQNKFSDPSNDGLKWIAHSLRSASALHLGLSVLPNAGQTLNSLETVDTMSWLAAHGKALTEEGKDFAIKSGAITDQIIADAKLGLEDSPHAIAAFAAKTLTLTGFNRVEVHNRVQSALAGASYAQKLVEILKNNAAAQKVSGEDYVNSYVTDPVTKVRPSTVGAVNTLQELFKFDTKDIARMADGGMTERDLLSAGKRMSDYTQFRTTGAKLPTYANTEVGKISLLFKQFAYNQARFRVDRLADYASGIRESGKAVADSYGALTGGTRVNYDTEQIMRAARSAIVMGLVAPFYGALISQMRNYLFNHERKQFKNNWIAYGDALAAAGPMGAFMDVMQSGMRKDSIGEDVLDYVLGPVPADAVNMADTAYLVTRDLASGFGPRFKVNENGKVVKARKPEAAVGHLLRFMKTQSPLVRMVLPYIEDGLAKHGMSAKGSIQGPLRGRAQTLSGFQKSKIKPKKD